MAASRNVPGWVKSIAGGLFASLNNGSLPDADTPRRAASQFGRWAAHLSSSGGLHWGSYLLRGEMCSFCEEDALGACIACNAPCCLAHSHVSHRGELICDECTETLLNKPKRQTKEQKAFKYFHLSPDASWAEVTAVYRLRSKDTHPDRGGEEQDMAIMSGHYAVLKKYFEKR